jgi:Arc/MetJ-type ribon-helix-helix transcriptional regulator
MVTISIRLNKETLRKLDDLVIQGIYKNRSEAIQDQIIKGLNRLEILNLPIRSDKHKKMLQKLLLLSKHANLIKSNRSAVDLVAEGRER